MDVSLEDFKQTKKLQVNWVTHSNSSGPDGSEMASMIVDGKISNRRCLSVLRCKNPDCKVETISGDYTWVCTRMDGILGAAMVQRERNVREGNKSELEKFDKEEPAQWHRAELDKEDETKRADKERIEPWTIFRLNRVL
ncbi:hypothetical protein ARMGADRAFT_1031976 [Armillaria gallica]|uniref:Uncharacterized protein n=1 Tax=Armillaria gallica TaxID=47427 RepID=A0A2H3DTV2_ARMGA|nr:hypothetical protein ARMGADRAFT_1031976 [Armillaria gallica]